MRTNAPVFINETNLSLGWAKAFLHVMAPGGDDSAPLVISLGGFENGVPVEDLDLRHAVDATLQGNGKVGIDDNAFMIFPHRVWRRKQDRQWLFSRYVRMLPKIRALNTKNCYGTYFGRMMGYVGAKGEDLHTVNQLDHILSVWDRDRAKGSRPRLSALQVACLDPAKDHTGQPVRGFPCLQQVSFAYDNDGGLSVSAYYPTQYVFDRGYGNYLGLCQLGEFMAHEMKLELVRLNCYVNSPVHGDVTKRALADLKATVEKAVAAGASTALGDGRLTQAGKV
jgi:hypothetical protein